MRAATAGETALLRTSPQWARLFLAGLESPRIVFAARVNQAFESRANWNSKARDMILQITYDTVTTGAYTDIIPGMTLWIGSAAGQYDIGQARIRKTPTGTILYIGESSDIDWNDNLYLTVVDEFGLWPRHVKITGGVPYIDGDIAYSNQHSSFDPVPILGSDLVLDIAAYPYTTADGVLDSSESWVFGSSITGHAWTASAGSLTDANTSTPLLTISSYPTSGKIRLKCTITAANGKTFSGYRYVHIYDTSHRPEGQCLFATIDGDYETGGWEFEVTMVGDASYIRDRAKVILFAEDFYGGEKTSIGQQLGRENIVCEGWIDGETIEYDAQKSAIKFTVKSAWFWLDRMPGFPPGVEQQRGSTGSWTSMPALTVDRALWHLLHWRSTATAAMDVSLTGDLRYASAFEVPTESLWQQMIEIAANSIFAIPCTDRFGRLFVCVDSQLQPVSDRDGVEVTTITKQDWHDNIGFGREIVNETSLLDLSGVAIYFPGQAAVPLFSLAQGHIFSRYGDIEILDRLLLSSQQESNELAGLAMGKRNNPWSNIEIKLSANNRMLDITPRQYCNLAIAATDTVRGVEFDGRIIPRSISYEFKSESGVLLPTIAFEAESFPVMAIDGDPPVINPVPPSPPPPAPPPPLPPPGPIPPTEPDGPPNCLISTQNFGFLYSVNFNEDDPQWFLMNGNLTEKQYKDDTYSPIRILHRDPISGYLYALIFDFNDQYFAQEGTQNRRGTTHLFCSPGLGGVWTQLLYAPDIPGTTNPVTDKPRIIALGVNPNNGNILVVGGKPGDMRVYSGNYSGVSIVSTDPIDAYMRSGSLVYLGTKWLLLHAEDNIFMSRAWSRLSEGGAVEVNTNNNFGALGAQADADHHGMQLGDRVLYRTGGSADSDRLIWIPNQNPPDMITADGLITGENTANAQHLVAADPTGQFLIGGGTATIGKRSSDYGASWGNVGTTGGMSTGYRVWGNCGDGMQFVGATSQKVMLTLDWGSEWIDKTGDLSTLAPLCSPNHILAWY